MVLKAFVLSGIDPIDISVNPEHVVAVRRVLQRNPAITVIITVQELYVVNGTYQDTVTLLQQP